jgi:predicted nucleic acid-binding protein
LVAVREVGNVPAINLDRGEAEAIALSQELHADVLLIDDLNARKIAHELALNLVGATGVLERAAALGLIDLEHAFNQLRRTTFRGARIFMQQRLNLIVNVATESREKRPDFSGRLSAVLT